MQDTLGQVAVDQSTQPNQTYFEGSTQQALIAYVPGTWVG